MDKGITMKTFVITLIMLGIQSIGLGQRHGVFLGVGTEYTVGGLIGNLSTGVELNRHSFGLTYLRKVDYSSNEYNPSSELWGVSYQFVFYREKHLQLGGMIRTGFVDDQFLVHVPSLTTEFVFNDFMKLMLTVGARGKQPAYGLNFYFNLPLKKNEFPHPILVKKRK